jgi:tetratricopeptide (TPR) repeat protein
MRFHTSCIQSVLIAVFIFFSSGIQSVEASSMSMQEALVELNEAVQLYQMGERTDALQGFLSISTDPSYPVSIQQESRIYMAEIMLLEGNIDGARRTFYEVLEINPNYNIDRFRHPPEICTEFDYTNAQWKQRQPVQSGPLLPTAPTLIRFVPFGIYQLQQNQKWKGLVYSGLQVGTAITSLTLFGYLQQNPGYNQNDLDEKARLESILTIQRASAIGFYTLWLMSSIDAQRSWQLEDTP